MMTGMNNPLDLNDQSNSGRRKFDYSVTTKPLQLNTVKLNIVSVLGPRSQTLVKFGQKSGYTAPRGG